MSASAEKATRRAIRRAIGDTASAALVEQSTQTAAYGVRLRAHAADLASVQSRLASLEALTTALACQVAASVDVSARPFLGRLRWLVTGR